MKIQLRFFASIREKLATSEETVDLPAQIKTVGDVRQWLIARGGVWAEHFAPQRNLRAAVNQDMTGLDASVKAGDEVAFFPPVTGG